MLHLFFNLSDGHDSLHDRIEKLASLPIGIARYRLLAGRYRHCLSLFISSSTPIRAVIPIIERAIDAELGPRQVNITTASHRNFLDSGTRRHSNCNAYLLGMNCARFYEKECARLLRMIPEVISWETILGSWNLEVMTQALEPEAARTLCAELEKRSTANLILQEWMVVIEQIEFTQRVSMLRRAPE